MRASFYCSVCASGIQEGCSGAILAQTILWDYRQWLELNQLRDGQDLSLSHNLASVDT